MAIPDYQTIMLPLLKLAGDRKEHSKQEAVSALAKHFNLTDAELKIMLYSGKQELFDNRVGWARTYLKKAGLINNVRWGYFSITDRGLDLLKTNPPKIDVALLSKYADFREFVEVKSVKNGESVDAQAESPKETISNASRKINNELARDVLQRLKSVSPSGFETIVVDLMIKMGYGGDRKDAVEALGRSGDGGVDGVIKQDLLGINRVYLQVKRYTDAVVGASDIRDFVGALDSKKADGGMFITTSTFTRDAINQANLSSKKIILIDGNQLANLMITHNAGVTTEETIEIKKIDLDYFYEE